MLLDAATLRDLDVLSASNRNGPSLLGLVDRTRTRVGQHHLRRRLEAPADAPARILALQRAHQAIAADADAYRSIVDLADPDGVERYVNSNWQLPGVRRGLAWFAPAVLPTGWRKRYLSEVAGGQARVASLLRAAAQLRDRVRHTDAAALQELGIELGAVLDKEEVRELRQLGTSGGAATRMAFDQLARERAKPLLTRVIDAIGTIEAMWSLAVATAEHGWSYPRLSSRFCAVGLYHPFLLRQAVGNDLTLDDEVRVCFVTGPNMAGKSTFLKAVAVAMLLGHAGCGVPATSLEFPTVGTIFSSVNVSDNLGAGESFYLAEVRRLRALATALQDVGAALAILDEPLRGTNVHDAAEATLAVMTRLAARPNALVFIASHISEIVPAMSDDRRICLFHFAADTTGDQPRFDYRLRAGVSAQRLGMTLLRREKVLELLERAR
jgi:DNA mismatch repair protein MutS